MRKELVGAHLMRVRIRKNIFQALKTVATEESERTGDNITVSDLVRSACYNFLLINESVKCIENLPPQQIEGEVLIVATPLLGFKP